ncbi:MAG: HypC/HybG/HupF family hydrogenase formation chaperone [Proteobacteria bacterium]|nr:HypC/HybG/HupF family hydrogenase formation chaperone [Pseudomonadota bacterium]
MCLAVPALVLEVGEDGMGLVDHAGNRRSISLMLLEDVKPGDYVILHAGFALHRIDEEAARETMEYLEALAGQLPADYDPNREM